MQLVDLHLSIPAQIWAVLHALAEDTSTHGVEEGNVDVTSRAFYAARGRAKGFVVSWTLVQGGTLNVSITESGGGDTICVMDWPSELPCVNPSDRPDDARLAEFRYRDVCGAADYVENLAKTFMSGQDVSVIRARR